MASSSSTLLVRRFHALPAALLVLLACFGTQRAMAIGEDAHVVFTAQARAFPLADAGHATALYVDSADWPGVAHAAANFAGDLNAVSGSTPATLHTLDNAPADLILIGTIGRSVAIDRLIAEHRLDVSAIRGHWEMSVTQIVDAPFPGVHRALVIAGADKRGTIFGIYDLSEQMGVSPWAWWADVPVPHHATLSVLPGRYVQPEPRVKYRGIFLNDEAPALSGWTQEKFGGVNSEFYTHVFDLLLRMKANFLWPAMWNNAFNEDDPADPKLADEYGIVMGTSHHEPMMRAQQEWKRHGTGAWDYTTNQAELDNFWREGVRRNKNYEELTTIGMRGDGDMAMSAETNTALLERIVADQRKILSEEVNPDVTRIPQVWALYKEVQGYYEKGMRVPDDVTLLWCDDNWGNIRRLPTAEERKRPGGAGIYYHFDYVGGPRSYKWLNTTSITKVQEQMNLAVQYGADRMWIVNVGDLKPMEFPIEFFLNFARTPDRWPADKLHEYTVAWATREFGAAHAEQIASIMERYTQYNSRRKPEMLEPTTWSLTQDHEADRVEAEWSNLVTDAERVNSQLPTEARPAFFELVLFPAKASATVNEMYIAAGRNNLYARQGRVSANHWADETRRLFAQDAALSDEYNHKLLAGKWDHMMDQTHIGYTFWNEPPVNAMPAVQEVQPAAAAHILAFPEGSAGGPFAASLPSFNEAGQTRTITLANEGTAPYTFTASASAPWVVLDQTSGSVTGDTDLHVHVDPARLPAGGPQQATITLIQTGSKIAPIRIALTAQTPSTTPGFQESNGIIAIDAEHASAMTSAAGITWRKLPGFGETRSGMETFPVNAASTATGPQACLTYDLAIETAGPHTLQAILAPTLAFTPGRGLRYSISVDAQPALMVDAWAGDSDPDRNPQWARAVSDGVHHVSTPLGPLSAGTHTLHLCRVDAGVVVERLLIEHDAPARRGPAANRGPATADASYLGPPESSLSTTQSATASTMKDSH